MRLSTQESTRSVLLYRCLLHVCNPIYFCIYVHCTFCSLYEPRYPMNLSSLVYLWIIGSYYLLLTLATITSSLHYITLLLTHQQASVQVQLIHRFLIISSVKRIYTVKRCPLVSLSLSLYLLFSLTLCIFYVFQIALWTNRSTWQWQLSRWVSYFLDS